jgi:hypothetical protein
VSSAQLVLDRGRLEAAGREQDVAVEPEIGELLDEPLVRLARAGERRLDAFLPTLRAAAPAPSSSSAATYEPSGRRAARSATVRQSHGAKHDSAPVWHAGPAGRTR